MEHRSSYKIYNKDKLICISHVGLIRYDSLNGYVEELMNSCDLSEDFNFIVDLREAQYTRDAYMAYKFSYHFKKNFPALSKRKYAIIVKSTEQIAMASIFRFLVGGLLRNVYVFNSIEEAKVWLGIKMDIKEITKAFEALSINHW
ncbi:hypothetical protein [Plebeiibacterium sediminum]|uniref:Uncharacterized protein n=1 Tax=Plebeiibacterium sediminum TaxID=2992112 RepID=A0AAE3M4B3_9BACT|nr:hypothetical protein [Plebeiobacterium sediminum]MCW3786400.1 hypothetical protein [Plebeiobacterium sediminum]